MSTPEEVARVIADADRRIAEVLATPRDRIHPLGLKHYDALWRMVFGPPRYARELRLNALSIDYRGKIRQAKPETTTGPPAQKQSARLAHQALSKTACKNEQRDDLSLTSSLGATRIFFGNALACPGGRHRARAPP